MARVLKFLFLVWLVACLGSVWAAQAESTADDPAPSANDNQTTLAPSTNDNQTTLVPSTNDNQTTLVPSTNDNQTTLTPSTNDNQTTLAPSTNDNQTTLVPSTNDNQTTLVPSTNDNQTTLTPSTNDNQTTLAPSTNDNQTTLAPSTNDNQTTLAPSTNDNQTTLAPSTNETQPTPTTEIPTTPSTPQLPDPCQPNPCGQGATCEPRFNQTFVCLCLTGDHYSDVSQSCAKAKVFPGQLDLSNLTYQDAMSDTASAVFLDTSQKILEFLDFGFNETDGYLGSMVLKLEPLNTRSRFLSRADVGVSATIDINFDADADISTQQVEKVIEDTICDTCEIKQAKLTSGDLCQSESGILCDSETTKCEARDGFYNCTCKTGYIRTNFSDKLCIGCPSGERAIDDDCHRCPFGYSGFNCNESWLLALVIVACSLGGLLLIALIVFPVLACRSSKKSKTSAISQPISQTAAEALLVKRGLANSQTAAIDQSANTFSNAGVPRIPRATSPGSWDRTNLEMTSTNSRENLFPARQNERFRDDDYIAPYAYSKRQSQINPYASKQGHSNPYYTHDDGRRFN